MSKTKKIEIEVQGLVHRDDSGYVLNCLLSREHMDKLMKRVNAKATITFEIPLPEPEVKITPSMIEEMRKVWEKDYTSQDSFDNYLKSKLFPDWKE